MNASTTRPLSSCLADAKDLPIDSKVEYSGEWDTQGAICIPFSGYGEEESAIDAPLAQSEYDIPEGPLLRYQAYRKAWDKCLSRIKGIMRSIRRPVVNDIVETVHSAYKDALEDIILPAPEMVTILVSSTDRTHVHECLAHILETLLVEGTTDDDDESESTPDQDIFVSRISQMDGQTLPNILKTLISGFITQPFEGKPSKKLKSSSSLASFDMHLLRAWYRAVQARYGDHSPPLVVVIQDIQSIDPFVLRDLFEICSCHIPHLPLVFILGSSDPNILHSILPRSTLTYLRLEKFTLPCDIRTLEHVVRETFFSLNFTPTVMLGPIGFEMIFREFKRHNSTFDAFLSTLQLLFLQHCYNPLSLLADSENDLRIRTLAEDFPEESKKFFELLRTAYISVTELEQIQTEWTDLTPPRVADNVIAARNTFQERMTRINVTIHILDTAITFARGHKIKISEISFSDIALKALQGLLDKSDVRNVCNLIRQLQITEAEALLEELWHLINNLPRNARAAGDEIKKKLVEARNPFNPTNLVLFLDFLADHFGVLLLPFDEIPCLDIWWTGDITIPNSPLNPNPRVSIVTSLLSPQHYLGLTGPATTEGGDGDEASTVPDACTAFRRYVDGGKMINIYDWYQSFSMALQDPNGDEEDGMDVDETPTKRKGKGRERVMLGDKSKSKESEKTRGNSERMIQARFMRAMHELEYVGFLKRTGRKADHVLKTVFDIID